MRGTIVPQHDRHAGHAFAADDADFDAAASRMHGDNGGNAGLRKIDLFDPLIGTLEDIMDLERIARKEWRHQVPVRA
jgi:hypothetical protein